MIFEIPDTLLGFIGGIALKLGGFIDIHMLTKERIRKIEMLS